MRTRIKTTEEIRNEWELLSRHLYDFAYSDFPAWFTTEQMIDLIWHGHRNGRIQPTYRPITREQIESLQVGDCLSNDTVISIRQTIRYVEGR